ncbi:hypothetical protein ASPZODRAFT_144541 [Penicilliopsis zonata CBS 506.65]|uniref:mRNA-capping enzyme subunit beta n=1 Tax=Penicilliopsis zonata CBS 506.65 TaxID=1073090 RepID=A0A1L9SBJ7_9EURO|nr:hypothetical protein ASPZODRAFT_144541 [Penicilliopsis zonata CBS 506.65]OJJ44575.1 hypothetical protein ASPZODRAFT_144541 [Penicilliopsis zonata CBS 506.65]
MDLRTIMNTDAAGASSNAPPVRQSSLPETGFPRPSPQAAATPSSYQPAAAYPGHPPQPPPIQPPPHGSPERSASYSSLQYGSPTALRSGSRDSFSTTAPASAVFSPHQKNQALPAAPLASPYTPQQPISAGISHQEAPSYFSQQRSHSIQSVLSPSALPSYSFYPRDSPTSTASQPLHAQQFASGAQRSLPGTPLGPPSATYSRPSPQSARPLSSGQDSLQNPLSSPWIGQDTPGQDHRNLILSPSAQPRGSLQDSASLDRLYSAAETDKERSVSVSPKTIVRPVANQVHVPGSRVLITTSYRVQPEDEMWKEDSPGSNRSSRPKVPNRSSSSTTTTPGAPQTVSSPVSSRLLSSSDPSMAVPRQSLPPRETLQANSSPRPSKRKKLRYTDPPIYAQRTPRPNAKCPVIPHCQPPIPKHLRDTPQDPWASRQRAAAAAAAAAPPAAAPPAAATATATTVTTATTTNTTTATAPAVRATSAAPAAPPVARNRINSTVSINGQSSQPPPLEVSKPEGSLGQWEPSITGFIPHEEITKQICDFLFQHVVLRKDIATGPAGAAAAGQGAIIEVEAKLGHIIDMDRGERLRLPVLTESVLNREDPRLRTSFESSMSQAQHRAMNNFLNDAVKASMPQSNPGRIPLSYAHKKERDTFYEVQASDLPPIIRQNLNPRHKPRVRVTTDQRTGEVLAKIVKCRLADMDVYSPTTCVDWRVSVNLEMEYDGDVRSLVVADTMKGARGARNKDRMSYRHLAYQIDLTQVARSENPKPDFDHELEIEISGAEIRRQGQLAIDGDPDNQYPDLIKGFVDNIRTLARAVPP